MIFTVFGWCYELHISHSRGLGGSHFQIVSHNSFLMSKILRIEKGFKVNAFELTHSL